MTDQAVEQSVEERMMAFLDAEEGITEEPQETPDEPETEEIEEDQETEDSEEEQPQTIVKLKINGEEVEKPLEEVVNLAQQGLDYTQKTQKVAEERKQLEQYAQTIQVQEQQFQQTVQMQQALIGDIAQITALDNQLAQFQNVNWNALSDNDPVEAQKLFFSYNQLQGQKQQLVEGLNIKQQQIVNQQTQKRQQAIHEGIEALKRDIPGWSDDKAKELIALGKDYGFSDTELASIIDPRAIKVLHDAIQWRKLQANPTANKKVTNAPPVLKPGSKNTKPAQNSQERQMREQLRKTGDQHIAAKLIERML